jgi:hypothetical protein
MTWMQSRANLVVLASFVTACGASHTTSLDAGSDSGAVSGHDATAHRSHDAGDAHSEEHDTSLGTKPDALLADAGRDASVPGDADAVVMDATSADACHGDPTPFPCMPSSIFYAPLPASPSLASNSAAIFAYYEANWDLDTASAAIWNKGIHLDPDPTQGGDWNQQAIYFAKESDPIFTIGCFEEWCANGAEAIDGVQIHIPLGATWQGYPDCADAGAGQDTRGSCGDDHFEVVSPDRTTEYDMYETFGCFKNGTTCLIGAGQFEAYATSNGFATNGVANATAWVPTQGLVLPSEILAGVIPHALALMFPCHDGSFVPPAEGSDGPGAACPDISNVLTEGQRVFLAATDAQIESWSTSGVTVPGQIVLKALAHYGGYYVDNQGYGGMTFWTINQASYHPPGTLTDDWPTVATQYGLARTADGDAYDLGVENVPGGISTWLRACSKSGC